MNPHIQSCDAHGSRSQSNPINVLAQHLRPTDVLTILRIKNNDNGIYTENIQSSSPQITKIRPSVKVLDSARSPSVRSRLVPPPRLSPRLYLVQDNRKFSGVCNEESNDHSVTTGMLRLADVSKPLPPRPLSIHPSTSFQAREHRRLLSQRITPQRASATKENYGDGEENKNDEVDLDYFFPPDAYKHILL